MKIEDKYKYDIEWKWISLAFSGHEKPYCKKWESVREIPDDTKELEEDITNGKIACIIRTEDDDYFCGFTNKDSYKRKILFINPKFWNNTLLLNEYQMTALKSLVMLAAGKDNEYWKAIDSYDVLAYNSTEKCLYDHHSLGHNFLISSEIRYDCDLMIPSIDYLRMSMKDETDIGRVLLKHLKAELQSLKKDTKPTEKLLKSPEAEERVDTFRRFYSRDRDWSKVKSLEDYKRIYNERKDEIMRRCKATQALIEEINLFKSCFPNGKYRDIDGICRLVDISEIKKNEYSLDPSDYL